MSAKTKVDALRSQIDLNRPISDARRRLLRICYDMPEEDVSQALEAMVPVILSQLKREKRLTAPPPVRRARKGGGK